MTTQVNWWITAAPQVCDHDFKIFLWMKRETSKSHCLVCVTGTCVMSLLWSTIGTSLHKKLFLKRVMERNNWVVDVDDVFALCSQVLWLWYREMLTFTSAANKKITETSIISLDHITQMIFTKLVCSSVLQHHWWENKRSGFCTNYNCGNR